MQAIQPSLPRSEAALRNQATSRLVSALAQANVKGVADWLFAEPSDLFHGTTTLSAVLFDKALAIRAINEVLTDNSSTTPASSSNRNSRKEPGTSCEGSLRDILLVPARVSPVYLLGYSFGALEKPTDLSRSMPMSDAILTFPRHSVGRFVFDSHSSDLLIVAHNAVHNAITIVHIQGCARAGARERNVFIVPQGSYGYRQLPFKIISHVSVSEERAPHRPRLQYVTAEHTGCDPANKLLAAIENMVKGTFTSARMRWDTFDERTGELISRKIYQVQTKFDAPDAIAARVLRELSIRTYFSYMSSKTH